MRAFSPALPVPAYNPFSGGQGAALYASPAGDDDPRAIEYRRPRAFMAGLGVCAGSGEEGSTGFPAPGDGPFGFDAVKVLVKDPDPLTWNLPDEYLDTTFWINIRPHLDGLELDTIAGPQRISVDDEGGQVITIDGSGVIVLVTKRDNGGAFVWVIYTPSVSGEPPTSLRLEAAEDDEITQTLTYSPEVRDYRFELAGMTDGETYTLQLIAIDEADGITVLDTKPFTADAAGPPAVTASFDVDD